MGWPSFAGIVYQHDGIQQGSNLSPNQLACRHLLYGFDMYGLTWPGPACSHACREMQQAAKAAHSALQQMARGVTAHTPTRAGVAGPGKWPELPFTPPTGLSSGENAAASLPRAHTSAILLQFAQHAQRVDVAILLFYCVHCQQNKL